MGEWVTDMAAAINTHKVGLAEAVAEWVGPVMVQIMGAADVIFQIMVLVVPAAIGEQVAMRVVTEEGVPEISI